MAIFFALPEYVRDVLDLPLFADRILYVDLYVAVFALVVCLLWAKDRQPQKSSPSALDVARPRTTTIFHATVFISLVLFAAAFFHGASSLFFPLQASVFSATLAVLSLLVLHEKHPSLLRKMNALLTLIVLWQGLVMAIGYVVPLPLEWRAPRNLWAYAAVLTLALNQEYGSVGARRSSFIKALLLIVINGTKAAIILLALVVVAGWMRRLCSSRPSLTFAFSGGLVAIVVIAHVAIYYYGMNALLLGSLAELEYAGTLHRSAIDNQLGSAVSRVFSVPYTLTFVIEQNALLGLGEVEAAKITFWGYPVHNLFVSQIAAFGLIGLGFSILYIVLCFAVARVSLSLFAVAFFIPMVGNDLYPLIVLCLLPLLTHARDPEKAQESIARVAANKFLGPPWSTGPQGTQDRPSHDSLSFDNQP